MQDTCSYLTDRMAVNKLESILWLDPAARKSDLVDFVDAMEDIMSRRCLVVIDAKGITTEIGSSVSMTIKALVKEIHVRADCGYLLFQGQQNIAEKANILVWNAMFLCRN